MNKLVSAEFAIKLANLLNVDLDDILEVQADAVKRQRRLWFKKECGKLFGGKLVVSVEFDERPLGRGDMQRGL